MPQRLAHDPEWQRLNAITEIARERERSTAAALQTAMDEGTGFPKAELVSWHAARAAADEAMRLLVAYGEARIAELEALQKQP